MGVQRKPTGFFRRAWHLFLVLVGASILTFAFFLVLPLIQTIAKPPEQVYELTELQVFEEPPPPPPEDEPEPEEQEQEETPPELSEELPPIDLDQLEVAIGGATGDGFFGGAFALDLSIGVGGKGAEDIFSVSDLDQKPRCIYQPSPILDAKVRKRAPGTVYVIFEVDERGRVKNPQVQNSSDPVFERPAIAAIKQWRFEPGKREGEAVSFRMRVPMTFPKGS